MNDFIVFGDYPVIHNYEILFAAIWLVVAMSKAERKIATFP